MKVTVGFKTLVNNLGFDRTIVERAGVHDELCLPKHE